VQALATRYNVSMYTAAASGISKGELTGRGASMLGAFLQMIEALKRSGEGISLAELVDEVLERSGMRAHYVAEREGADRLENLAELVTAVAQFVELYDGDDEPLTAFLSHASLEAGEHEAGTADDALQLMTVHSAKGLEFDAVFITGLEEGLFPHENSLSSHEGLEEERRLMYVAITRARKRLYLSFAQTRMLHGRTSYNIKSRFFEELPEDALKWLSPRNAGFGSGFQPGFAGGYGGSNAWRSSGGAVSSNRFATNSRASSADFMPGERPFSSKKDDAVPSASGLAIKAGMQVFHTKFGEGKVLAIEGQGDDARAQVQFGRHGVKWLALSVAKLTPVQ
jgi:DNA helicase II / ATP-dependent DNA helicase PcrA